MEAQSCKSKLELVGAQKEDCRYANYRTGVQYQNATTN